jgi:hypothetical protein
MENIFISITYSSYWQKNWRDAYYIQPFMSEWLLFNTNSAIFQLYHGENKLIFNEIMKKSALY